MTNQLRINVHDVYCVDNMFHVDVHRILPLRAVEHRRTARQNAMHVYLCR